MSSPKPWVAGLLVLATGLVESVPGSDTLGRSRSGGSLDCRCGGAGSGGRRCSISGCRGISCHSHSHNPLGFPWPFKDKRAFVHRQTLWLPVRADGQQHDHRAHGSNLGRVHSSPVPWPHPRLRLRPFSSNRRVVLPRLPRRSRQVRRMPRRGSRPSSTWGPSTARAGRKRRRPSSTL